MSGRKATERAVFLKRRVKQMGRETQRSDEASRRTEDHKKEERDL